jgi:histidinol-phosphatase (PHP family)
VELGLPAIAFTEHADFTPWTMDIRGWHADELPKRWVDGYVDGAFTPPALDVPGYLACLDACRDAFPGLRILSGVEVSEPHWHPDRSRELLATGAFDRVLASVHAQPHGSGFRAIFDDAYARQEPEDLLRWYLREVERLAEEFDGFEVLAHIDYPVRYWPGGPAAFDPEALEKPFRAALAALARSGRMLEINTRLPLSPLIVGWWHREGGSAVTFGSDAHNPDDLAHGFHEAAAIAEAHGFRPGGSPHDPWART